MSKRIGARMIKCSECPRMFEQKPYTNKKRCQYCAAGHEAARDRARRKKAIINHADDCECGGCAGVDHK